jgi:hypothetical protein
MVEPVDLERNDDLERDRTLKGRFNKIWIFAALGTAPVSFYVKKATAQFPWGMYTVNIF